VTDTNKCLSTEYRTYARRAATPTQPPTHTLSRFGELLCWSAESLRDFWPPENKNKTKRKGYENTKQNASGKGYAGRLQIQFQWYRKPGGPHAAPHWFLSDSSKAWYCTFMSYKHKQIYIYMVAVFFELNQLNNRGGLGPQYGVCKATSAKMCLPRAGLC